ncbi:hypothetical protein ACFW9N_38935 [Streptomyces sp. NPDC059496]|uniref:hypothetical protein n=1 Tax=Streptomyces sp. NPDC059496 TaxID=3346851 RepID=UPI0036BF6DD5
MGGPLPDRHQVEDANLVQDEGVGAGLGVVGQRGHGEDDQLRDGRQQPRQLHHLGREPRRRGVVSGLHRQDVVEAELDQVRGSEGTIGDMN